MVLSRVQRAVNGYKQLPVALDECVVSHFTKTRAELRAAGIAGFLLMAGLAAIVYFFTSKPTQNLWVMAAGAAPILLTLVIPSFLDPRKSKAYRALASRSDEIVWLYVRQITGAQRGAFVTCGLSDGKLVQIPCVVGQEQQVLAELAAFVPHATVGFSPAKAEQFARTPSALRR